MEIQVATFAMDVRMNDGVLSLLGVAPTPEKGMPYPVHFVLSARFASHEASTAIVDFSLCDPDGLVLGETHDEEALRVNPFDGSGTLIRIWNIDPPLQKQGHYVASLKVAGQRLESTLVVLDAPVQGAAPESIVLGE